MVLISVYSLNEAAMEWNNNVESKKIDGYSYAGQPVIKKEHDSQKANSSVQITTLCILIF